MKSNITKQEAINLIDKYLPTETLKFHSIETEVIMRKLAIHFHQNEDLWGITGLLHDLDLDVIKDNYVNHGITTIELLRKEGFEIPEMFEAIKSHTESIPETNAKRTEDFHFALAAAENITGLITAYVLMRPEKKLDGIEAKSIKKRLKEKRFAAGVNREFIADIEKTGLSTDLFIELSIQAMKEIASEINM